MYLIKTEAPRVTVMCLWPYSQTEKKPRSKAHLSDSKIRYNFNKLVYMCMPAKLLQLCPTLCDPTNYSIPGSSVHGILQAGILSGLPCPPPGDLLGPGIECVLSCLLHWQEGSLAVA